MGLNLREGGKDDLDYQNIKTHFPKFSRKVIKYFKFTYTNYVLLSVHSVQTVIQFDHCCPTSRWPFEILQHILLDSIFPN